METTKIEKTKKVNRRSRQRYLKHIYNNTLSHNIYSCSNANCIICAKSFVANLSGKDLSDPQILLLSKGLSFIPTARDSNSFELLRGFDSFSKKIRALSHTGYGKNQLRNSPLKGLSSAILCGHTFPPQN